MKYTLPLICGAATALPLLPEPAISLDQTAQHAKRFVIPLPGGAVTIGLGGINVVAPGTNVNVGADGVKVNAPGTNVGVGGGGVQVAAPGTNVGVGGGGVQVTAPFTNVGVGPGVTPVGGKPKRQLQDPVSMRAGGSRRARKVARNA